MALTDERIDEIFRQHSELHGSRYDFLPVSFARAIEAAVIDELATMIADRFEECRSNAAAIRQSGTKP